MSRIGKLPIEIPESVMVKINNHLVIIRGPQGELEQRILPGFHVTQTDNQLIVTPQHKTPETQRFYGLLRTLLNNMVIGVSRGFAKELEIKGVGYRAQMQGRDLVLRLGFSHPIAVTPPEGVLITVANNTRITVAGYDKQKVGAVAANIRALKKPEPYKGKGIKYIDERIRRKAGKTAAKGAA